MQGRHAGVEQRRVGKRKDIARFVFCGSGEGDVLKTGRRGEASRLRESYAGQRPKRIVLCEGRGDSLRTRVTGRLRGLEERERQVGITQLKGVNRDGRVKFEYAGAEYWGWRLRENSPSRRLSA